MLVFPPQPLVFTSYYSVLRKFWTSADGLFPSEPVLSCVYGLQYFIETNKTQGREQTLAQAVAPSRDTRDWFTYTSKAASFACVGGDPC